MSEKFTYIVTMTQFFGKDKPYNCDAPQCQTEVKAFSAYKKALSYFIQPYNSKATINEDDSIRIERTVREGELDYEIGEFTVNYPVRGEVLHGTLHRTLIEPIV